MPYKKLTYIGLLILSLLTMIGIATHTAPLSADILSCMPSHKFFCSKDDCVKMSSDVNIIIDTEKLIYSRCDNKGCDKYNAIMKRGALYLNITLPDRLTIAKIEIPTLRYFEIVSLGLGAYNSFGKCISKSATQLRQ